MTRIFDRLTQNNLLARSDGIILIDGKRLTEFMIEYGVGVSHRTVKVPSIDQDYFEEVVDGNK